MFHLSEWLRFTLGRPRSHRARAAAPAPAPADSAPPHAPLHGPPAAGAAAAAAPAAAARGDAAIAVLLITRDPRAAASLRQIAEQSGWRHQLAASLDDAVATLALEPCAVVVLDRDLPGQDWRRRLARLALVPQSAGVLLASTVADEYLWQEVSHHRGLDILRKPFARDEVVRAVEHAWSWRRLGAP